MTVVGLADAIDDELVEGQDFEAGRTAPGMQGFVLFVRDVDGMLHGVAEAYRCGCFAPAVGHEKRNHFGRVAAAVAERQYFFASAETIFVQRLLEAGRHPGRQCGRVQVTQVEHRVAAQRELVENLAAVMARRAESPEYGHRKGVRLVLMAFRRGE